MGGSSRVSASSFPLPTQCSPPFRRAVAAGPGTTHPTADAAPLPRGDRKNSPLGRVARRDGGGFRWLRHLPPLVFRRVLSHGICIIPSLEGVALSLSKPTPEQSGAKSKGPEFTGPGSLVFPYRGVLGSPPPREWFRYPGMPRAGPSADRQTRFDPLREPGWLKGAPADKTLQVAHAWQHLFRKALHRHLHVFVENGSAGLKEQIRESNWPVAAPLQSGLCTPAGCQIWPCSLAQSHMWCAGPIG